MMNYEKHLPVSMREEAEKRRGGYEKTWLDKGLDPEHEMAKIIYASVENDGFQKFGMYWWAVKDVLKKQGFIGLGDSDDRLIKSIYSGKDDIETLILAFMFSEWYNANLFQGSRSFEINALGESYELPLDQEDH